MVINMIEVLFDRLMDMSGIDIKETWLWPGALPITLEEVMSRKREGVVGDREPYGDTWKHPVKEERDKDYHIARIIYFVNNPNEIDGIEVDNPCVDNGILPGCAIIDGWHRIAAAVILKLQKINIHYGGRSDVEDYISGKTDNRPEDILFLFG